MDVSFQYLQATIKKRDESDIRISKCKAGRKLSLDLSSLFSCRQTFKLLKNSPFTPDFIAFNQIGKLYFVYKLNSQTCQPELCWGEFGLIKADKYQFSLIDELYFSITLHPYIGYISILHALLWTRSCLQTYMASKKRGMITTQEESAGIFGIGYLP